MPTRPGRLSSRFYTPVDAARLSTKKVSTSWGLQVLPNKEAHRRVACFGRIATDIMFTQTITRVLSRLGVDHRSIDPHPRQPTPMLLQKADAMFSSADLTYEAKRD